MLPPTNRKKDRRSHVKEEAKAKAKERKERTPAATPVERKGITAKAGNPTPDAEKPHQHPRSLRKNQWFQWKVPSSPTKPHRTRTKRRREGITAVVTASHRKKRTATRKKPRRNKMAIIKEVRGFTPKIGDNCYLAETAAIIGDVTMGDNCSIWFGTVLRGDVNSITIGNNVNIQDGAVVHTLYQRSKTTIGDNVSIGHNATVHGATIESNCLIGMGATILDNAVVESGAIVAANALITSGMRVESGWIYAGVPAKKIKEVSKEQQEDIVKRIANDYIMYASWYE